MYWLFPIFPLELYRPMLKISIIHQFERLEWNDNVQLLRHGTPLASPWSHTMFGMALTVAMDSTLGVQVDFDFNICEWSKMDHYYVSI